ncbi:MAG: MBL fold metallo-hydrolase [Elusimicrobiota bacterium]
MNIKTLALGPLSTNCYIVYGDSQKEALVIDPAGDSEKILKESGPASISKIIFTHAHWDHIGGAVKLKKSTGARIILGEKDQTTLNDKKFNLNKFLQISEDSPPRPDELVEEDDIIEISGVQLEVLETPGHTPGSISLYSKDERVLFCGDALFAGSVGRCDLPGGDMEVLKENIKQKILSLEDDVKVYPGHGPSTTVGKERKDNPFI